jgi:hypothetical protein
VSLGNKNGQGPSRPNIGMASRGKVLMVLGAGARWGRFTLVGGGTDESNQAVRAGPSGCSVILDSRATQEGWGVPQPEASAQRHPHAPRPACRAASSPRPQSKRMCSWESCEGRGCRHEWRASQRARRAPRRGGGPCFAPSRESPPSKEPCSNAHAAQPRKPCYVNMQAFRCCVKGAPPTAPRATHLQGADEGRRKCALGARRAAAGARRSSAGRSAGLTRWHRA